MASLRGLSHALRAFARLSDEERRFAARAFALAPIVEGALAALGLQRTIRVIDALPRSPRARAVDVQAGARLVHQVYRHHVVRGTCLPRAVLQYGLHRLDGAPAVLEIGVRRASGRGGAVEAHAYLRGDGTTVDAGYAPLVRVGGVAAVAETA